MATSKRVEIYKDRVIIKCGEFYGCFWSAKKYHSLHAVREAINTGEAYNGISQDI